MSESPLDELARLMSEHDYEIDQELLEGEDDDHGTPSASGGGS
jgi:hypothetical protein